MTGYLKILAYVAAAFVLLLIYFGYRAYTANDLEKRLSEEEPIGIRVALVNEENDDALEVLGQVVLYPHHDRILFYLLNTDASYEGDDDPISSESPRSADRFSRYTGVDNDYTATVTRANLARLLDLAEGLNVFLEDAVILENGLFQYPRGRQYWPGEQVVEYALGRVKQEPDRVHLSGVERLLRIESVLLNYFWNKQEYLAKFNDPALWLAAAGLIDMSLSPAEARSLLEFIARDEVHSSVLEVPLEQVAVTRFRKRLVVKDQRAKLLYNGFSDDMAAGRLNSDQFSMEVLNGTEISRLANRVQQYMKDRGGQVLDADNYPYKPVYETVVLERSGNSYNARKLLEITGMKPERVYFRRQVTDVKISLVLGEDFDIKKFFK